MPPRIALRSFLRPIATRPLTSARSLSTIAQFLADPPVPLAVLVPTSTILLRTVLTLPFTIYARKNTIKMMSLQPLISAWSHTLAASAREGSDVNTPEEWTAKVKKLTKEKSKEIYGRHGCGIWRGFAAGWATLPVWIGVSYTLRGAVAEEGLMLGGFGWIMELSDVDPYGVLSVAAGAVMFLNAEYMSYRNPTTTRFGKIIKNVAKTMALGVIPISILQPAILPLYWLSSAVYTVTQNFILETVMPIPKLHKPSPFTDNTLASGLLPLAAQPGTQQGSQPKPIIS